MNLIKTSLIVICLFIGTNLFAQEKEASPFSVNGYVKNLQVVQWFNYPGSLSSYNFLHNRLNFEYIASDNLSAVVQLRNRFFVGQSLNNNSSFANDLDQDLGLVDLSFNLIEERSAVFNSTIDRAFVQYSKGKFDLTLGRQRINWGQNFSWNPNDIFNALNFLDFDYEERPGTDAARLQFYPSALSRIELAIAPAKDKDEWVGALLYGFNLKGYDFQLIAGNYLEDYVLGAGWSGEIKSIGFKGELSYFSPKENQIDSGQNLSAALSLDYSFPQGIFISASVLFNQNGPTNLDPSNSFLTAGSLSAKNLFPTKYAVLAQCSGSIASRYTWAVFSLYAPGSNIFYAGPSLEYSLSQNWELGGFLQAFWLEQNGSLENFSNIALVRLRLNF